MKIPVKIFKKYTQAGPNYQCYPTTLAFQECIKQEAVIEKIHGLKESTINLQLHVPLCRDPDYHSTTHQIQLANSDQLKTYIACLKKEISIYKRYINKVKVAEIHLSGNEVSLLDSSVFNQIIDCLAETFEINLKQTNLSIDINARLLDSAQLVTLKNIGFSSLKISTLNFDYKLQTSLKSHQSYQQTEQLIRDAKHLDFEAINVELLYGLPGESINGIKKTIDSLCAMKCDQISLTHYIHRPYIFKLQKKMNHLPILSSEESYNIFRACIDKILTKGYVHLGMNTFIQVGSHLNAAEKQNKLNYNHTGYTSNNVNDVVSFGAASISLINDLYYQNMINIDAYNQSIEQHVIPVSRGCSLTTEQLFRKKIIKNLIIHKHCIFDRKELVQLNLLEYIDETCSKLRHMESDGLVRLSEHSIQITELGQYFLKNICALFDLNMLQLILYEA